MHEVDPFSANELIDASTQIKFGTSNYLFITEEIEHGKFLVSNDIIVDVFLYLQIADC